MNLGQIPESGALSTFWCKKQNCEFIILKLGDFYGKIVNLPPIRIAFSSTKLACYTTR